MKTPTLSGFFLLLLMAWIACKEAPKPTQPLTLGSANFQKSEGRDCPNMDSLRNHCAKINLSWPEVNDGSDSLKTAVSQWAGGFLINILANAAYDSTGATSLESAAQAFFTSHAEWSKDAPDSPLGEWTVECTDTTLLNDGKHLTLQMNAFMYTGGAHGASVSNTATFDVASGKQLTWADLLTDETALKTLAEKKFREVRADIFLPMEDGSPGFNFDEIFQFALPANYGLTDKGIYFHYDPYEVTPYALGTTGFVITFEELGALIK